jgi:hypothetical protein
LERETLILLLCLNLSKDSSMTLFGPTSRDFKFFQFLVAWDQVLNRNIWFGRNGILKKELKNWASCQRVTKK